MLITRQEFMKVLLVAAVMLFMAAAFEPSVFAGPITQYEHKPSGKTETASLGSIVGTIRTVSASILKIIMIMGAALGTTLGVFHMMKGDKEGVTKLFLMAFGCGIGFALLTLLQGMGKDVGSLASTTEAGLGELKGAVKGLLETALSIVCMFTLTGVIYQMVTGTQDSSKKLFGWALTSAIGLMVLQAF